MTNENKNRLAVASQNASNSNTTEATMAKHRRYDTPLEATVGELEAAGFQPTVERGNTHIKVWFEHGGRPHRITCSFSHSDFRAAMKAASFARRYISGLAR